MEESRLKEIEKKLQEMIELRKQIQSGISFKPVQTGRRYVVRRRKNEKNKRICISKNQKYTTTCQISEEK